MPFQPGQSGNPGGKSRELAQVIRLAQQHGAEAVAVLAAIMNDPAVAPAARVSAAEKLLDRGFGKPAQPLTGEGGEGPVEHLVTWLEPSA